MASLFEKLLAIRDALNYGEKLKDSASWKDKTVIGNSFACLLVTLAVFVPELQQIPEADLHDYGLYIGWAAYVIHILINNYFHKATSDKVGFGKPDSKGKNEFSNSND